MKYGEKHQEVASWGLLFTTNRKTLVKTKGSVLVPTKSCLENNQSCSSKSIPQIQAWKNVLFLFKDCCISYFRTCFLRGFLSSLVTY